jgi:hypothetical protein
VIENEMKLNPGKIKAGSFTKAGVKERIRYYFGDQLMAGDSSCKYLGIIIWSDLNWADRVNYRLRKPWKALHFVICTKPGVAQRVPGGLGSQISMTFGT